MDRLFTHGIRPRRFRRHAGWPVALAVAVALLAAPLRAQDSPCPLPPELVDPIPVRGPYVQLVRPTSIVIRWRSADPTDSRVRLGPAPDNLTRTVTDPLITTEHEIEVVGLSPDTRFYYSVGSTTSTVAGGDRDHFFFTAPLVGSHTPTRVWVTGDIGTNHGGSFANGSFGRCVREAYQTFTADTYTNVWITLGDNAYTSGTESQLQFAIFQTYHEMLRQTAIWPSLGNHDGLSSSSVCQTGPYYEAFTLPTQGEAGGIPSGTEAFYSFDYANIHFVCLESCSIDRTRQGVMLPWLERDLADNRQDWVIAYFHHPPYTRGSHNSDGEVSTTEMRELLMPVLEEAGADLVLAGHSHSYERSYLLNGHYGLSSTLTGNMVLDCGDGDPASDGSYRKSTSEPDAGRGTVYVVTGSSGGQFGFGPLNHPVMHFSTLVPGSLVVDVEGLRLEARFVRFDGVVMDRFVVEKTDDVVVHEPCTTFLRGDANVDGVVNVADPVWILLRLFGGLRPESCEAAGDADADELLRVTDAIYLLRHLFQGGTPPPAPFPSCGDAPDVAGVSCQHYLVCP